MNKDELNLLFIISNLLIYKGNTLLYHPNVDVIDIKINK